MTIAFRRTFIHFRKENLSSKGNAFWKCFSGDKANKVTGIEAWRVPGMWCIVNSVRMHCLILYTLFTVQHVPHGLTKIAACWRFGGRLNRTGTLNRKKARIIKTTHSYIWMLMKNTMWAFYAFHCPDISICCTYSCSICRWFVTSLNYLASSELCFLSSTRIELVLYGAVAAATHMFANPHLDTRTCVHTFAITTQNSFWIERNKKWKSYCPTEIVFLSGKNSSCVCMDKMCSERNAPVPIFQTEHFQTLLQAQQYLHWQLNKLSLSDDDIYLNKTKEKLSHQFAIIFNGCSGDGRKYVAFYATFFVNGRLHYERMLFALASMGDEESHTAEDNYSFLNFVLFV